MNTPLANPPCLSLHPLRLKPLLPPTCNFFPPRVHPELQSPRLTIIRADICNPQEVAQAASQVGQALGDARLTALVNNAGISVLGPLLHTTPEAFRKQLDVNTVAPLIVLQAFAPLLGTDPGRRGPPGKLVQVSSTMGSIAFPFCGPYCASKHGTLAHVAALYLSIRVMLFSLSLPKRGGGRVEEGGGERVPRAPPCSIFPPPPHAASLPSAYKASYPTLL